MSVYEDLKIWIKNKVEDKLILKYFALQNSINFYCICHM